MDSENRLRQELTELNLLLAGLAKIPSFPGELLELISGKIGTISLLTLQPEKRSPSNEPELFPDSLFDSEERNLPDQNFGTPPDSAYFEVMKPSAGLPLKNTETLEERRDDSQEFAEKIKFVPSVSVERINDQLEQKRMSDLNKSLTLNDRFRYQREFFGNDSRKMSEAFSALNETQSTEEALTYLRTVCSVDEQSESFQDFCTMLHLHFANMASLGKSDGNEG